MDKEEVRKLIVEATKSLTVHDVEVVEIAGRSVHFRIIAEAYAALGTARRVLTVLNLIKQKNAGFADSHLLSVDPLTPEEFHQFYDASGSPVGGSTGSGQAAKPAEA